MAGFIADAETVHHCTPDKVLGPVRAYFDDLIELDPCSNPKSIVDAKVNLMLENGENGLLADWRGLKVYCNPPYGKMLPRWILKASMEALFGARTVMLIPAATGSKHWQKVWKFADGIIFNKGRVHFRGNDSSSPFQCAMPVFDYALRKQEGRDKFEETLGTLGHVVYPRTLVHSYSVRKLTGESIKVERVAQAEVKRMVRLAGYDKLGGGK